MNISFIIPSRIIILKRSSYYIDLFFVICFSFIFRVINKFKDKENNILIIQLVALGDMVCASSFYRELRKQNPYSKIITICHKNYYDLYNKYNPYIDKFILFDDSHRNIIGKFRFFHQLFKYKIVLSYDLTGGYFSKFLGYSTYSDFYGIDLRESGFNWVYKNYFDNLHRVHIVNMYFRLLAVSGFYSENKKLEFWKPTTISLINYPTPKNVVIAIGAKNKKRVLSNEKFIELIDFITDYYNYRIILIGDKTDKINSNFIMKYLKNPFRVISCVGDTSILDVGNIIEKTNLLIANDSGIGHIGACFDIPIISIFGSGYYQQWHPYSNKCVVVRDNNCEPCGNNPKCDTIKCLTELKVCDIIYEIKKILGE